MTKKLMCNVSFVVIVLLFISVFIPMSVNAAIVDNTEYSDTSTPISLVGDYRDILLDCNYLPTDYKQWPFYTVINSSIPANNYTQMMITFDENSYYGILYYRDYDGKFYRHKYQMSTYLGFDRYGNNSFMIYHEKSGQSVANIYNLTKTSNQKSDSTLYTLALDYSNYILDRDNDRLYVPLVLVTYDNIDKCYTIHRELGNRVYIDIEYANQYPELSLYGYHYSNMIDNQMPKDYNNPLDYRYEYMVNSYEIENFARIKRDSNHNLNTLTKLATYELLTFNHRLYLYNGSKGIRLDSMYADKECTMNGFQAYNMQHTSNLLMYYTKIPLGDREQVVKRYLRARMPYNSQVSYIAFGNSTNIDYMGRIYNQLQFIQPLETIPSTYIGLYKPNYKDNSQILSILIDSGGKGYRYMHTSYMDFRNLANENIDYDDYIKDETIDYEDEDNNTSIGDIIKPKEDNDNNTYDNISTLKFYYEYTDLNNAVYKPVKHHYVKLYNSTSIYADEENRTSTSPFIAFEIEHTSNGGLQEGNKKLKDVKSVLYTYDFKSSTWKQPDRINVFYYSGKDVIRQYTVINVVDNIERYGNTTILQFEDKINVNTDISVDKIKVFFEYNNLKTPIGNLIGLFGDYIVSYMPSFRYVPHISGGVAPFKSVDDYYNIVNFGKYNDIQFDDIITYNFNDVSFSGINSILNVIYAIFGMFGSLLFAVLVIFLIKKLLM